jgi:hypothetical protein
MTKKVIVLQQTIRHLFGTPKLTIEMIPSSMHGENLHNGKYITVKDWVLLRHWVVDKHDHRCELCGGCWPDRPLECHEVWRYEVETEVQRLVGLQALCQFCHQVKHAGLAARQGKMGLVITHLAKVNGWPNRRAIKYKDVCFALVKAYDELNWTLDVSFVARFGIVLLPTVVKPVPIDLSKPVKKLNFVSSQWSNSKSTVHVPKSPLVEPVDEQPGLAVHLANDIQRLFDQFTSAVGDGADKVKSTIAPGVVDSELPPPGVKPKSKPLFYFDTIRYPYFWLFGFLLAALFLCSCSCCMILLRL